MSNQQISQAGKSVGGSGQVVSVVCVDDSLGIMRGKALEPSTMSGHITHQPIPKVADLSIIAEKKRLNMLMDFLLAVYQLIDAWMRSTHQSGQQVD
jgi:hypothetical protein